MDAHSTANVLAETIAALPGLDRKKMLLFGGWESATRGAGVTLQLIGERLGILDQFQGVDQIDLREDGSFEVLERVEGGMHEVSICAATPRAGMGNRQSRGAAKQSANRHGQHGHSSRAAEAKLATLPSNGLSYTSVSLPKQQRATRVVKDMTADGITRELVEWIAAE